MYRYVYSFVVSSRVLSSQYLNVFVDAEARAPHTTRGDHVREAVGDDGEPSVGEAGQGGRFDGFDHVGEQAVRAQLRRKGRAGGRAVVGEDAGGAAQATAHLHVCCQRCHAEHQEAWACVH